MSSTKEIFSVIQSDQFTAQVRALLPPNVGVDRFTRTTMVAINQNPDVLQADRQSLYNAICRAASDGLLPDGKQGALVIYNQKQGNGYAKFVRFMPMVEGIIHQLAKANIPTYAVSVYANDEIEVWNDDAGQHVKHRPVVFGNRGDLVGVMAVAQVADRTYVETMNLEEIDKVRSASRSGDRGPWQVWYDRMAQKSVLHRLKKRLPIVDAAVVDSLRDPEEELDSSFVAPPEAAPEPVVQEPAVKRRPRALEAVVAPEEAPPSPAPTPTAPPAPPVTDLSVEQEDLF